MSRHVHNITRSWLCVVLEVNCASSLSFFSRTLRGTDQDVFSCSRSKPPPGRWCRTGSYRLAKTEVCVLRTMKSRERNSVSTGFQVFDTPLAGLASSRLHLRMSRSITCCTDVVDAALGALDGAEKLARDALLEMLACDARARKYVYRRASPKRLNIMIRWLYGCGTRHRRLEQLVSRMLLERLVVSAWSVADAEQMCIVV